MKATRPATPAKLQAIGVLLLLLLVPSACGGGGSSASSGSGGASSGGGADRIGETGAGYAASGEDLAAGGSGAEFASVEPEAGQAGAQAGVQAAGAAGSASAASVAEGETLPQDFDRRIVKNADLGIHAEDVRESAAEAQRVAAGFGGGVLSSRIYDGDGPVHADLVLSVPSPDFEAALDELRGLGERVTTDAVSGQDVTEEFVDLESRERNLLAAEQSLLKLYEKAEDVDDTLTVERELTNIRGQIEEVQGRLKYLESRTANSQIALSIEPLARPAETPGHAWNPNLVVARAWGASLGVLQGIATVFLSAIVFGWWLAPAFIVGLLLWRRRGQASRPAADPSHGR